MTAGGASLAAARRFARVTSTDYVPQLLEKGAARASAEGLEISFAVADAESLPYPDAAFDVVLSTFGVMFTPDPRRAASELLRVSRPGARIGLANWTPQGFLGDAYLQLPGRWTGAVDFGVGAASALMPARGPMGYAQAGLNVSDGLYLSPPKASDGPRGRPTRRSRIGR